MNIPTLLTAWDMRILTFTPITDCVRSTKASSVCKGVIHLYHRYRLNANAPLTTEVILKYLEADAANDRRKRHLYEYYVGK